MDNTFVVWGHGEEELHHFLDLLNSVHQRIQFTMEKDADGKLAFLDLLVHRKTCGGFEHRIYRKHTDCYLRRGSNHQPRQKRALIKTLTGVCIFVRLDILTKSLSIFVERYSQMVTLLWR